MTHTVAAPSGPYYKHGLTYIPAWISNYIHYKVWDKITYPFPNLSGANHVSKWGTIIISCLIAVNLHQFVNVTASPLQPQCWRGKSEKYGYMDYMNPTQIITITQQNWYLCGQVILALRWNRVPFANRNELSYGFSNLIHIRPLLIHT